MTTPAYRDIYGYFGPNFLGGDPSQAGNNAGSGTSALGLHWVEQPAGRRTAGTARSWCSTRRRSSAAR